MDRELLRLRKRSRIASLSAPFHRRQQSVTRLSQEHDDQAVTDPYPVARLVA